MSRRIVVDELDFRVEYGEMCAKTWHEETDSCQRVLMLHGWMDNSGSFDKLAPLLRHKDGLYLVALDLPGHGRSSQLPPGMAYSDMTMIVEIRRCLIELGWIENPVMKELHDEGVEASEMALAAAAAKTKPQSENERRKFIILGHSFGAGLGLLYASLFPDDVETVLLMDFIKPKTTPLGVSTRGMATAINRFLHYVPTQSSSLSGKLTYNFSNTNTQSSTSNSNNNNISTNNDSSAANTGQVVVSQETAIIATIDAHKQLGALSRDDAACLLKRCTISVSNPAHSVIYTRDLRLQCMFNMRDYWGVTQVYFGSAKCRVFSLLGKSGVYINQAYYKDHFEEMVQMLEANVKSLHIQWIPGDHYLHMNNFEQAAQMINKYLEDPENYLIVET